MLLTYVIMYIEDWPVLHSRYTHVRLLLPYVTLIGLYDPTDPG